MYEYIIYISNFVRLANNAARKCNAILWMIAASLSSSSPYDGDGVCGDDDNYLANNATMTTTSQTTPPASVMRSGGQLRPPSPRPPDNDDNLANDATMTTTS